MIAGGAVLATNGWKVVQDSDSSKYATASGPYHVNKSAVPCSASCVLGGGCRYVNSGTKDARYVQQGLPCITHANVWARMLKKILY
jgi:hypothetical protein